jgi:peptidoglycan/LPS O-acetylase OafA/YrhL
LFTPAPDTTARPAGERGPASGYRPEIDGLRAIAVGCVVVYHAGFELFGVRLLPGGFLGVDVFFVISGYLIGSRVLAGLSAGTFSLVSFYEHRARRILPALYAMLAVSLVAGWFLLFSGQMLELGTSALATVTFWSNVFFWQQGGYAAEASTLRPLLHTWSLSVEEQFYLLFPLAILLLHRALRRAILALLILGAVLSLGLAECASGRLPSASFYLLPTRVWELLAGVILAQMQLGGTFSRAAPATRNVLGMAGLLALLLPAALFDENTKHPGILTAIPVAATALIIWLGAQGWAARLLSIRPLVVVGLMSYSIYLWHQPLFAFARLVSVNALTQPQLLGLTAMTAIAGALSYRFVERPFRDRSRFGNRSIWVLTLGGLVVLAGASAIIVGQQGFPTRFPAVLNGANPKPTWTMLTQNGEPCHRNDSAAGCHFEFGGNGPHWVLIGDSHAGVLATGLYDRAKTFASSFDAMIWGGCPVIFDVDYLGTPPEDSMGCYAANQERRAQLRALPPSVVVYSARMGAWLEGTRFDNGEGGVEPGYMDLLTPTTPFSGDRTKALQAKVTATIKEILSMGHQVVLVYPVPEVGWNVPQTVRKLVPTLDANAWIADTGLTTSRERYFERNHLAFEAYDAVGEDPRLVRIYPDQIFCDASTGRCHTHDEASFFYSDDDHLSAPGADQVIAKIMQAEHVDH